MLQFEGKKNFFIVGIIVGITVGIFLATSPLFASDFREALKNLSHHPKAKRLDAISNSLRLKADGVEAWKDPVFKMTGKNFPVKTASFSETPMTGFEVGLSQSLSLSPKKSLEASALRAEASAIRWEKEDVVRRLRVEAWILVIEHLRKEKEILVLKESLDWLKNEIHVTQSLYANGHSSQQAVLEIQIRISHTQSKMEVLEFEKQKLEGDLKYLLGKDFKINKTSIPWQALQNKSADVKISDAKEASLMEWEQFSRFTAKSKRLAKIPDIQVGLAYTFRSKLDKRGDFVSFSLRLPIPITKYRQVEYAAAKSKELASSIAYLDYKEERKTSMMSTEIEIKRIIKEQNILEKKSLRFAQTSRDIVSKSYGLGNASYIELLAAELSLQNIRLKKISLWANLWKSQTTLQFIKGGRLW